VGAAVVGVAVVTAGETLGAAVGPAWIPDAFAFGPWEG
jgi:Flp pilus assembly pilin Flp